MMYRDVIFVIFTSNIDLTHSLP